MANERIVRGRLYMKSKNIVNLTDKNLTSDSGASVQPVQGGVVVQDGQSTGQISFNFKVTRSSGLVKELFEAKKNRDILPYVWAPVGAGNRLNSRCLISNVSLNSNEQDGDHSGSVTLLMVDGEPDVV